MSAKGTTAFVLLEATQKRFGVVLDSEERGLRETFNLGLNEYLFHSKGIDIGPEFLSLFGRTETRVRAFTVGELYDAVRDALEIDR